MKYLLATIVLATSIMTSCKKSNCEFESYLKEPFGEQWELFPKRENNYLFQNEDRIISFVKTHEEIVPYQDGALYLENNCDSKPHGESHNIIYTSGENLFQYYVRYGDQDGNNAEINVKIRENDIVNGDYLFITNKEGVLTYDLGDNNVFVEHDSLEIKGIKYEDVLEFDLIGDLKNMWVAKNLGLIAFNYQGEIWIKQ